jgi:hypothetical protein
MNEIERILFTSATTIVGGAFVFVVGQLASRFLIEPCYEQRRVIGLVAEALLNYMYLFVDSGDTPKEGAYEAAPYLRKLSSELMARTIAIPGYSLLSKFRVVRKYSEIEEASRGLLGLANTVGRSDWERKLKMASKVAVNLGIDRIDSTLSSELIEKS